MAGWILAFGLIGAVLGPVIHHLGVRAAVRRPFEGLAPRCESCETPRPTRRWFSRRCRSCDAPIRQREPWIWLMVGVGFAGAMWVARFTPLLPAHLAFVMVTSILVVTDFDEKLIPNRVLFPGTAISAALLAAGAAVEGRLPDLGRGLAVAAGYVGLLFLVAVLARGGFGLGDVKLAALLGLFLGFWGWFVFARGLLLIGLFGGIPALVLIALRRAGRKDEFPYGPAMVFGAWAALAIGDIGGGVF